MLSSLNPFASRTNDDAPRYISAKDAQNIDAELMGSDGAFSLDQLMELAGFAIAQCLAELYPLGPQLPLDGNGVKQKRVNERVLVCCGPGNQGGDGLVAARHLHMFGYSPSIFYPKQPKNELYQRLLKQCENLDLPLIAPPPASASSFPMAPDAQQTAFNRALSSADVVLDCIFGFSFHPPARAPFDSALKSFKKPDCPPVLSVDIPSGWDVEEGNVDDEGFTPDALLSLTAPKNGVRAFAEAGRTHWLGGRFIPGMMNHNYDLRLPAYPGTMQCVDITKRA